MLTFHCFTNFSYILIILNKIPNNLLVRAKVGIHLIECVTLLVKALSFTCYCLSFESEWNNWEVPFARRMYFRVRPSLTQERLRSTSYITYFSIGWQHEQHTQYKFCSLRLRFWLWCRYLCDSENANISTSIPTNFFFYKTHQCWEI